MRLLNRFEKDPARTTTSVPVSWA